MSLTLCVQSVDWKLKLWGTYCGDVVLPRMFGGKVQENYKKSTSAEEEFINIFVDLREKLGSEEVQFFAVLARQLWLRWNSFVFGGPLTAPAVLVRQAHEQMAAFEQAETVRSAGLITQQILPPVHAWMRPMEGFLKVNWDASLDLEGRRMGMGIAILDHNGTLLAALCATKDFITDPTTAEAYAVLKAVEFSHSLGLRRIILEGDALEIVSKLKHDENWLGSYGNILLEEKQLLCTCIDWKVQHVHRQGNRVAHQLAKLALQLQQETIWTNNFPSCI